MIKSIRLSKGYVTRRLFYVADPFPMSGKIRQKIKRERKWNDESFFDS